MDYRILVGSYTDSLFVLTFNTGSENGSGKPTLTLSSTIPVGHHPSWVAKHPADPSILFAVLEQPNGQLLSLKLDTETLKASITASASTLGADPCTILIAEQELIVGNYSSGVVGFFRLPSASTSLESVQTPLQFSGTGPDSSRQEKSHPHQVYLRKDRTSVGHHEILVPDLGADKTWRLARNAAGIWELRGQIDYSENLGGGPRHVVVHDDILYTLLELSSTLVAHTLPPLPASPGAVSSPVLLASSSTLIPPPPVAGPDALPLLAAEILIPTLSANFPTAYIYVSNRNEAHIDGDTIAIFETLTPSLASDIASVQTLKHVASHRTGLSHLRGMIFFGADDRYLIAGGAQGGGIKVFERINGGRVLQELAHLPVADSGDPFGLKPTAFVNIE